MTRARWIVVAAVAACLLLTAVLPTVARVEGMAMAPTLDDQDRAIVNRWAYALASPQPGDIVMLRYPLDESKFFVKRIVAEGGDTVRIEDGRVYVNGQLLDDEYVAPEARSHDDRDDQAVPFGHYFVMGDRRNNSSDSRHWGTVPEDLIVGRVVLRFWPSVKSFR